MSRTKYETVQMPWGGTGAEAAEVVEPGAYHPERFDCGGASESEDGCRWCQEELENVEDLLIKKFRDKRREVLLTFHSNIPRQDGFWEIEVESRKL